jgi:DtxR family Mn-dependent transcriptional regulator
MQMSELQPNLEELLEIVWMLTEDMNKKSTNFEDLSKKLNEIKGFPEENAKKFLEELINLKFIEPQGKELFFSKKGHDHARQIIRRHRLYERLFHDVLQMDDTKMESGACEYEHVISEDVEESVCTLLGHPRTCPHNRIIPPGRCCERKTSTISSIIVPITNLDIGETGTVAYITSQNNREMDKLLALGILPGNSVKLHQKMPFEGPIVLQIDQTQVALEKSIANQICVRRVKKKN